MEEKTSYDLYHYIDGEAYMIEVFRQEYEELIECVTELNARIMQLYVNNSKLNQQILAMGCKPDAPKEDTPE